MIKRLPLLIAILALAVWAGNFIIKNFLAVSLIAFGQQNGQQGESRDKAVGYAPGNAEVLAARARYLLHRADPPRIAEAIADLNRAVTVSPRDYRHWLELGRAYDSDGQQEQAEKSLQRAVELAPRYFEPRWALANLRLRVGKLEPSVADFREAIALSGGGYGNASTRPDRNATLNAYAAVAGAFGTNLEALRRITPPDNAARAYLAEFLTTHDALDQAVEIWRGLPGEGVDADSDSYRDLSFQLLHELQSKNRFGEAREIWNTFVRVEGAATPDANTTNNLIFNSGFEQTPFGEKYAALFDPPAGFDWTIRRHPEVRISRSNEGAHSGSYVLYLNFAASMSSELQAVSQLIAVEPVRQYRLSYSVKTKNISSLANEVPFIEITDAANPAAFSLRSAAPSGTANWSEQGIVFSTTENTRGLRLTIRSPQLKVDRTRIAELWLDDFKLERLN